MRMLQETDVLAGLHGVGLGYVVYLPDNALLVELNNHHGFDNLVFLNMASKHNHPYYAVDGRPFCKSAPKASMRIPPDSIKALGHELLDAWNKEQEQRADDASFELHSGECSFPRKIDPVGEFSSSDYSRCYLHRKKGIWIQCPNFCA